MDWVKELRAQFPVADRAVFLDIAYENCAGLFLNDAVLRCLEDQRDVSPDVVKAGGGGKGRTIEVVQSTREAIARLLGGVDPCEIAFTKNTNEGINMIVQGFAFEPGDNIITDDQEHPSVLMSCLNAARRGVECRVARAEGAVITPDMLLALSDERTRMIVVSHVQSHSGYKIDLPGLAAECKRRGIYLVVDAIQSLGFCPFDAPGWGVDAVASAGYKGLLGAEGVGFLYCAQPLLDRVDPVFTAANAHLFVERVPMRLTCGEHVDARKLENSSMNFMGIYALQAGLRKLEDIGIDRIERHISGLVERLHSGLCALGFELLTPRDARYRGHSVTITHPDPQGLYGHFQRSGIFISLSAARNVRLSVAAFSIDADIAAALAAAARYKQK